MPLPKEILDNISNVTPSTIDSFTQHVANKFNPHFNESAGNRRAQHRRCQCQHRSNKRHYVRGGCPHCLDLADPMFRRGLGEYMRQELSSMAQDFVQRREPRPPNCPPQPYHSGYPFPPGKHAMTAEVTQKNHRYAS